MTKKIIYGLIIFFIFFPINVRAAYQNVDRTVLTYNINNFYIENNNIIINGWAVVPSTQHFLNSTTHGYSMLITNKINGTSKTYNGSIKNADKTELMALVTTSRICNDTEYNASELNCYYRLPAVGFEFKIPLSDLEKDSEYSIKLQIDLKGVGKQYQSDIYILGINNSYDVNNVNYQLTSDINNNSFIPTGSLTMVRDAPFEESGQIKATTSCSGTYGYLYRKDYSYTTYKGYAHTNLNGIDDELWIKFGLTSAGCIDGRHRVNNGSAFDGWAAFIHFNVTGNPATIKTKTLQGSVIEEIKTYTAKRNSNAKVEFTVNNLRNQTINIKAFHDNTLVYETNSTFNGLKTFVINYSIPNSNDFKIEVVEDNNYKSSLTSKIYISSEDKIILDLSHSGKIEINTPVLVVKDKNNNITEFKETIEFKVNNTMFNINQGRGIDLNPMFNYYFPLSEFSLNDDFNVYALYPDQEATLNFPLIEEKVKVDYDPTAPIRETSFDSSIAHMSEKIYVDMLTGTLYKADNLPIGANTIVNNNLWFPPFNSDIGTYEFTAVVENIGVNGITIIRNCKYSVYKWFIGTNNNYLFYLKRVKNPEFPNFTIHKSYTYQELMNLLGDSA